MFLKDRTGNRRFWPITGDKDRKTKNAWELSKDEIDQLWAEAFTYWAEGEPLVLEGELEEEALRIQLSHTEGGELVGLIEESSRWNYLKIGSLKMSTIAGSISGIMAMTIIVVQCSGSGFVPSRYGVK